MSPPPDECLHYVLAEDDLADDEYPVACADCGKIIDTLDHPRDEWCGDDECPACQGHSHGPEARDPHLGDR